MSDDFDRYGPKFVCNRHVCTVRPSPPVYPLSPSFYYAASGGTSNANDQVVGLPYAYRPSASGAGTMVLLPSARVNRPYWNPSPAYYDTVNQSGWVEVGFLLPIPGDGGSGGGAPQRVVVRRRRHRRNHNTRRVSSRSGSRSSSAEIAPRRFERTGRRDSIAVARGTQFHGDGGYAPRSTAHHAGYNDDDDGYYYYDDDDDDGTDDEGERRGGRDIVIYAGGAGCAPSSIDCRWRRYRLYARAPYGNGIRAYTSSSTYQYGVQEEDKRDGLVIALSAYPLLDDASSSSCRSSYGCGRRWAELSSGDAVRVPGEPLPYRVHLYTDEADPYYEGYYGGNRRRGTGGRY